MHVVLVGPLSQGAVAEVVKGPGQRLRDVLLRR